MVHVTIMNWKRSHKDLTRKVPRSPPDTGSDREKILDNYSIPVHTLGDHQQSLDLKKLVNSVRKDHQKLCVISAKPLDVP